MRSPPKWYPQVNKLFLFTRTHAIAYFPLGRDSNSGEVQD